MKGKNLYLLIQDLDKSEKHKILNTCKRSGDKRHKLLYNLIKKGPKNKDQYSTILAQISDELFDKQVKTEKDALEKDKIVRRFVDFSIKEVEQLKLKELLQADQKMRNYLLSRIYRRPVTQPLFRSYLKKTQSYAEKEHDPWMLSYCLDHGIMMRSQSQKKRDMEEMRRLLLRKNELIQSEYHSRLSEVYNLLSGLFLNDKTIINELENLLLEDAEIDALVQLSGRDPVAIEYKIAQSRFHLEDEEKLNKYIAEAEALLENCNGTTEQIERLKRRLIFLKIVDGFHYGKTPEELSVDIHNLQQINEKYDIRDGLAAFYELLIHFLQKEDAEGLRLSLEDFRNLYFSGENSYMFDFVNAYLLFLEGDFRDSLWLLSDLSYAPNFYIAIWSRLLEFRIHHEKENYGLCESLLERASRQMRVNQGKIFTYNSNAVVLAQFYKVLGLKVPKSLEEYSDPAAAVSPLHAKLVAWAQEKIS